MPEQVTGQRVSQAVRDLDSHPIPRPDGRDGGRQADLATPFEEAVVAGAFGGVLAGFASHYLASGKMTFPIFMVAYVLVLANLKGWGRFVGLAAFTAAAALAVVVLREIGPK